MTHAHEILHMMEGNSYDSKEALIAAITEKFGSEERFFACSVDNLDAAGIVEFLEQRGKFMPASTSAFTVDINNVCNH